MAFGLQDILNPQFLSDAYAEVASASVSNPFLDFYTAQPRNEDADTVEMVYYPANKQTAPANIKGAPAKTRQLSTATKKYFTPVHAFNEIAMEMRALEYLRQDNNPQIQDRGRQEINRQFEIFGFQHRQLKAAILAKTLVDGIVYFDSDYNVLEDSSGADTSKTIDLGVASGHKTTLNWDGNGAIIDTKWDQAGALILNDLDQIGMAAEAQNAERPRHIWLNSTAKEYIRGNTQLKSFIVLNSPWAAKVLDGVGDSLEVNGYTFHFYDGTYVGADGSTVRKFIPDKKAIITPDLGPWFRYMQTTETIPTQIGLGGSVDEMLAKTVKIYGDFAYMAVNHNPLKFSLFCGCNFFFGLANPNSIWCATVGT